MAKNYKIVDFPTQYTESVEKGTFETFRKPSMTEPDNAMSIPEIIARYTRGYGVSVPVHDWTEGVASEGDASMEGEDFWKDFRFLEAPKEQPTEAPKEQSTEAPKVQSISDGAE